MSPLNIPRLNGLKTALGGYGLIIIGISDFLAQSAAFARLLGDCLAGQADVLICAHQLPPMAQGLAIALTGLLGIGIGHKIEKTNAKISAAL